MKDKMITSILAISLLLVIFCGCNDKESSKSSETQYIKIIGEITNSNVDITKAFIDVNISCSKESWNETYLIGSMGLSEYNHTIEVNGGLYLLNVTSTHLNGDVIDKKKASFETLGNGTIRFNIDLRDDKEIEISLDSVGYDYSNIINISNEPPIVTYSTNKGTKNFEIKFNSLSYDIDGVISEFHWDFGDGNTSSNENPNHIYSNYGSYTVKLTVKDNFGERRVSNKQILLISDNDQNLLNLIDNSIDVLQDYLDSITRSASYIDLSTMSYYGEKLENKALEYVDDLDNIGNLTKSFINIEKKYQSILDHYETIGFFSKLIDNPDYYDDITINIDSISFEMDRLTDDINSLTGLINSLKSDKYLTIIISY